jgi:hypothetical protein
MGSSSPVRRFKSPARIEQESDHEWRLLAPLVYVGSSDVFVVHDGFRTDLASVPRMVQWLVPRSGRFTRAAILHDALWHELREDRDGGIRTVAFTPKDADGLFRAAMRDLGVSVVRRRIMYWAVRAAGAFTFRERSKRGGAGVAFAGAVVVGLPVLVPLAAYLALFGFAELVVYKLLRVRWSRRPDRLEGVPWPFARQRADPNDGRFLTVRPKEAADVSEAVRLAVEASELPLQRAVRSGPSAPAAVRGADGVGTAAPERPEREVAATIVAEA